MLKLGAPIFNFNNPEEWIEKIVQKDFKAVFSPFKIEKELSDLKPYSKIAANEGIVISELGIWKNPIDSDRARREQAISDCKKSLYYADELNILCTVNVSGSRGDKWDGPHEKNLTSETFDMIVEVVREIIDQVNPKRAFYTLEAIPWMYPDTVDTYVDLIKAIDRKKFAVHFDPVNLVTSPQKYFNTGDLIHEFVTKLGEHIKSVHLKDISISPKYTLHLDEVLPGRGNLDYRTLLRDLSLLNRDVPIMLEHLQTESEYDEAVKYVRLRADQIGVNL